MSMYDHITWEYIMSRPEILLPPAIFYLVFFWGLPILGCVNTKRVPAETLMPYWRAVFQVSGILHLATAISIAVIWILWPFMVIS